MRKRSVLITLFASISLFGWSADKEIIVETFDDGFNAGDFRIVDGKWNVSATKSQAEGVKATKSRYNDADATPGTVRFEPQIPVEGKYEVFITYASSGNAKDVIYRVSSTEGVKEEKLTQNGREFGNTPAANKWHSLGVFTFKVGKEGFIEISDPLITDSRPVPAENARIYVDAVKLVPQGFELPADYANKVGGTAAEGAVAAATTPAAAPSELPSLPPAAPTVVAQAAPADGLPALPGTADQAAPVSLDGLPSLPSGENPAPASSPSSSDGLPSLPGQAAPSATEGLPSLPSQPAPSTGAVDSLPALPGSPATPAAPADGLPSLPSETPAAPSTELPSLPSLTPAAPSTELPSLPSLTPAPTPATELPSLPALPPVTPTPSVVLPSVSDTPAAGTGMVMPILTPAVPLSSSPILPPATGFATPAPASNSGTGQAGLQWIYDFGASLAAAKSSNKAVLVFFTANGNRAGATYETTYFQDPLVRKVLDNYVPVKIDFPQNTRMAYNLGVFGAGILVVADSSGKVIGKIEQIPGTPTELVAQLVKLHRAALGTPAEPTAIEAPAADTATTTVEALTTEPL